MELGTADGTITSGCDHDSRYEARGLFMNIWKELPRTNFETALHMSPQPQAQRPLQFSCYYAPGRRPKWAGPGRVQSLVFDRHASG